MVSHIFGDGHLSSSQSLEVANCRSVMWLTWAIGSGAPQPGQTITRHVQPDDEAAFDRFLDEVVAPDPIDGQ